MSLVIAVDFDGTCVKPAFPLVGAEVPGAVTVLRKCLAAGDHLLLWTLRTGAPLSAAVDWFTERGLTLTGINVNPLQAAKWKGFDTGPKVEADIYIDDRALGCPLCHAYGEKPYVDWRGVEEQIKNIRKGGHE
jgi:hypothetical protein